MAQKNVRDVMTKNVIKLPGSATVIEAAREMRGAHIGAVLLEENGRVTGLLTDRDITIRAVADGLDPKAVKISDIASRDIVTLSPDDPTDLAVEIMREHCVRRVPVVEGDRVVGIVSLGDLAIERDRKSVLGHISASPPNH
jgi:CBS domain-containing protein